jgi:hypothetical protein
LGGGAYAVQKWQPPAKEVRVVERESAQQVQALQALTQTMREGAVKGSGAREEPMPEAQAAAESPPSPPSPAEAQQRWQQRYRESIAQVQAEPRDAVWATETERAFQKDFADKAARFDAKLLNVECHETGCLARVEWSSYSTAMAKFTEIPHSDYATNCAIAIEVGERVAEDAAPHQATVVFHCREQGS